jgi:hypothetical protein
MECMMAKTKTTPKFKQYPTPDGGRCGCKVSWNYYRDEQKAKQAAEAASHNADILWARGYDFGYQTPGQIVQMKDEWGGEFVGMWQVTLP